MSYIKRMKLEGFKSFANPTILHFEKGFNTVVGANGSGKSNVFDALCFVLGRMSSKGLRAEKLGNLVFNGGKGLKPAREAEVSIFLSNENKVLLNSDLEEIKISRVVTPKGQSTYLLNNNKVTRTEILEILSRAHIDPDGYNIILQGDIMRIVNMSPIERRELVEEVSNISGYEEKRTKALKKLNKVETDLKEADLLMEEKTKYLKELKSEKDQAQKFHETKESLRYNTLLFIRSKLLRTGTIKKKKEEDLQVNEEKLNSFKDKLKEFDDQVLKIDKEIEDLEKAIEITSHKEFIEVTNKVTSHESKIESLKQKKAELKKQLEEINSRQKGIDENIKSNIESSKTLKQEISLLEKDKTSLEKELLDVEKSISTMKGSVSSKSFQELEDLDEELEKLQSLKFDKDQIRQDNEIQVEKLNTKLEHYTQELDKMQSSIEENKDQAKQLKSHQDSLKKLILSISQTAHKQSELSAHLGKLQMEYSQVVEDHSRARMRVEASKDLMATNRAVDSILKLKSNDPTIHGTVAELAKVPHKYSLALETVAGKSLFNVIVENDSTAVKYINYLKDKRIGNATFLPLNKVNRKVNLDDSVLNKKGVIDYALNLISYDKRYDGIYNLVFHDTLVIERIEDAKGIGIGSYKMVTLEGDVVAKTGAMSGGFRSRSKSLGAFQDEEANKKVLDLEGKANSLKSTIDHMKSEKDDCEQALYDLRQEKMSIESEVAKLEKILSIGGKDYDNVKREIEALESDKSILETSLGKAVKAIDEIKDSISKLSAKKAQLRESSGSQSKTLAKLAEVETQRDELRDKLNKIKTDLSERTIQLRNVVEPEVKNLEKIKKETLESKERVQGLVKDITEQVSSLEVELKGFKAEERELSKGYKDIISKRDSFKEDKKKLEKKYEKEFEKFDSIKEKSAQLRYAISEHEALFETLQEELDLFYAEVKAELIDESSEGSNDDKVKELVDRVEAEISKGDIDVKSLQHKVNNLKTKLSSFGSINMKAVQVYDKLNEEFTALLEKREVLNKDKTEILEFVAEMDEKKKERFMETFAQLREHFVEIFSRLSTKGEAELNLENEKDLFNTGVDIRVRLSKTNYLDIKSLSGGEKTITAIAFIFAVQEFNPASFYIFDEVDAALDIMNSEKLGKLIREYSGNAQYIVVSHSEHFIQSSQSIYGVTMDKNKVSGVVSLDLSSAAEYVDDEESSTV